MTSAATEKSEIRRISFTFPITAANENFNLAGALGDIVICISILRRSVQNSYLLLDCSRDHFETLEYVRH
jgi:hypothetical protein